MFELINAFSSLMSGCSKNEAVITDLSYQNFLRKAGADVCTRRTLVVDHLEKTPTDY